VYAAGGITPDDVVKYEKASKLVQRLQAHGLFFNFAVDYLAKHPNVPEGFPVDDSLRNAFFEYVQAQGLGEAAAVRREYQEDPAKDLIDASIRTEILNSKYGLSEGWKSALKTDRQAQAGLGAFPEAERIASLPKKSHSSDEKSASRASR
jgi:hypothetical protein